MAKALLIKAEKLHADEHQVVAPLGILSLAASARAHGHSVDILDLRVVPPARASGSLDDALSRGPDVVGLGCVSWQIPLMARMSRRVRAMLPRALVLAGGPGPSSDTEQCLHLSAVDACVVGEGEQTFVEILDAIDAGSDWRNACGIARRGAGGDVTWTRPRTYWSDLDSLPLPAWDLHDFDLYARFIGMAMRTGRRAEVLTSRGCPYRCIFCHSNFGKRFRPRSPDRVVGEMVMLRDRHGVRRFEVLDDIFNFDRDRTVAILQRIRDELPGVALSFPNGIRGDSLDEETIRLFGAAGTDFVAVGVSTASPRLQKVTEKRVDLDALERNVRLLRKHGMRTAAFFLVGIPGETNDEVEQTFDMASRMPVDFPIVSVLVPFRGTRAWEALDDKVRAGATVEALNPRTGWESGGFSPIPNAILLKRAEALMKRAMLRPRNWYVVFHKLVWEGPFRFVTKCAHAFAPGRKEDDHPTQSPFGDDGEPGQ